MYLGLRNQINDYMPTVMKLNLDLYDHGDEIFITEQVKKVDDSKYEMVVSELKTLADRLIVNYDKLFTVSLEA
jgi:hypothetical protein